ncbi:MAG: hypothetical protein AAF609_18325 [Cyanobacteria bacterium P01_C01_bin.120]
MNAAGELRAIAHFNDENAANYGNTVAKCVVVSNSELVCLAGSGADEPLFGRSLSSFHTLAMDF